MTIDTGRSFFTSYLVCVTAQCTTFAIVHKAFHIEYSSERSLFARTTHQNNSLVYTQLARQSKVTKQRRIGSYLFGESSYSLYEKNRGGGESETPLASCGK